MQRNLGSQPVTLDQLEKSLKKAADLIRTRVDYKYILILLFLKRMNDIWKKEREEAVQQLKDAGIPDNELEEHLNDSSFYTFQYPEKYTWDELRADIKNLPINLSDALKTVAEQNPDLQGVLDRLDFLEFTRHMENFEILKQLFELFSGLDLSRASPDIMGDAYEWILSYFAPQKAKEGEVYTPREVVDLLVRILNPNPLERVYDPCFGSGGMLIDAYQYVKNKYGDEEAKKLFLYGQEYNQDTYALARMNTLVHGIRSAEFVTGDTLLYPKLPEDSSPLGQFDKVIANPPWNQDGYGAKTLKKAKYYEARFNYGPTPNNSADWAWVQHMIASGTDNSKIGIVLDNGALFRGNTEKKIRKEILKNDLIETVILLPEKLFYNTGAPGAILIFNKNKPEENKNKVLFINASAEYKSHPRVRKLNILAEENIKKLVSIYNNFEEKEGVSRVVPFKEIKENDYNLNVTLYVFPEAELEDIDVEKEWEGVEETEKELEKVNSKIKNYLSEIKGA